MHAKGNTTWMSDGLCKGMDPKIFFTDDESGPMLAGNSNQACWWCNQCPVQEACLEYAILNKIEHGIWGGTTFTERRRLIRVRQRQRRAEKRAAS